MMATRKIKSVFALLDSLGLKLKTEPALPRHRDLENRTQAI